MSRLNLRARRGDPGSVTVTVSGGKAAELRAAEDRAEECRGQYLEAKADLGSYRRAGLPDTPEGRAADVALERRAQLAEAHWRQAKQHVRTLRDALADEIHEELKRGGRRNRRHEIEELMKQPDYRRGDDEP